MFQTHILVGHVGDTPELRQTGDDQQVTTFSVAVNERRGENQVTTWYRVTAWNRLAEVACQYLSKGRLVLVEGHRLRASAYLGREGQPQASLELTASRIQFLDSGSGGEEAGDIPF